MPNPPVRTENLPSGRLGKGKEKVAGVATTEAYDALRELQNERGVPTMSQALGIALQEWLDWRRKGVQSREPQSEGST